MKRSPALLAAALLLAGCGDLRYVTGLPRPTVTLQSPAPIELPFREASTGLVLLTGRVNGTQDVDFILDTGAPVTVLVDGPRTAKLGLDTRGARLLGPEGDPASPIGVIRPGFTVAFGPVVMSDLHAVIVSQSILPCPERFEALGFGGVVGADLFRRFVVEIDWKVKRVRLHEPSAWTPPAGAAAIPLVMESGHPYVDVAVEVGSAPAVPVRLHLDSGMNKPLTLTVGADPAFVMPAEGPDTGGCFVNGRSTGRDGAPVAVTFGSRRVDGVTPSYAAAEGASASRRVGAIGAGLLRRQRVAIDFPAKRMFLLD